MTDMDIVRTSVEGVIIIRPEVFDDSRGCFLETFSERFFCEQVRNVRFVQDNESRSVRGVLRGLHFQKSPHAQGKLVRVVKGAALDVAVDIRRGSPTFGSHVAVELNEDNRYQMFIPRGFAHGFVALTDDVVFQYKCDNYYSPESEEAIAWDDPDLGIDWRLKSDEIILSAKDRCHPRLKDADWLFDYNDDLY